MKAMLFFAAILWSFTGYAQSDFAPVGAKWYYNYDDGSAPLYGPAYYDVYESVGDVSIGGEQMRMIIGKAWRKYTGQLQPIDTIYVSATPDTVYYYHKYFQKKVPLLVFNVQAGDTIKFYDPWYPRSGFDSVWHSVVDSVRTFTLNGRSLRRVYTHELYGGCCSFWGRGYAEMLGSFDYFTHLMAARIPEDPKGLRCYTDAQLAYHTDTFACDAHPPALDVSNADVPLAWQISPNPVSEKIKLRGTTNSSFDYTLYSAEGRLQLSGSAVAPADVDIAALPAGLYWLRLRVGEAVYSQRVVIQR